MMFLSTQLAAHSRSLACSAARLLASAAIFASQASAETAPSQTQVQQWLQQGAAAMRAGQPAQAVAPFTHAAQAEPQAPQILLGLGLAQLGAGEFEQARTTLGRTLSQDPNTPSARLFLGIAEYQLGDLASARADISTAVTLQPDDIETLTWMGIVQLSDNQPEAAAAALDHAAALAPTNASVLYYQARAHTQIATTAFQSLYKLDPDSALVHRALGESMAESGQPEKAIGEFTTALNKQPGNADVYEELANEDQKLSRFDDASKAYQQELKLNPHSAIALYNLGKIDVERGKAAAGVTLLQQAIALHASTAPAQFYLGLGLAELNKYTDAAQALQASLGAAPSPFIQQSAWYQLGRVYERSGRKAEAQHAFAEVQRLKASAQDAVHQAPAGSP